MQLLLSPLDQARGTLLELCFRWAPAKRIFFCRSQRLLFLSLAMMTGALFVSTLFPLWVLVLGPILYGYPHLISTVRYVALALNRRTPFFFGGLLAVYLFASAIRIADDLFDANILVHLSALGLPFEWWFVLLCSLGLALATRSHSKRIAVALLSLTPLLACAWFYPFELFGALVLGHNLVAFVYWYRFAHTAKQKRTVIFATLFFLAANGVIFTGGLDGLYQWLPPQGELSWLDLNYWDTAALIFPDVELPHTILFHATVAYAFGQSTHYFIWLKAIPDQAHHREVPTTFRASWQNLKADFSGIGWWLMLAVVLGGTAVWAFAELAWARTLYFSAVALHGYLEIAGIVLPKERAT